MALSLSFVFFFLAYVLDLAAAAWLSPASVIMKLLSMLTCLGALLSVLVLHHVE